MTKVEFSSMIETMLAHRIGHKLAQGLTSHQMIVNLIGRYLSYKSQSPGRHYSFLAIKS